MNKRQPWIWKIENGAQKIDTLEFMDFMRACGKEPAMAILELDKAIKDHCDP